MTVVNENGFAFIDAGTAYYLAGFTAGNQQNTISIPEEIMGKKVSNIYDCAFSENKIIEAVNISKKINTINTHAFKDCINLKYLFFDNSSEILNIQDCAFSDCLSLTGLTILRPTMIHGDVFKNCTNLRCVDGHFLKLGANAFHNCELLHTVNLHSYVHVDPHAFDNCNHLANIYFRRNIKGSFDFLKHLNPETIVHCRPEDKLAELVYEGYKIVTDVV